MKNKIHWRDIVAIVLAIGSIGGFIQGDIIAAIFVLIFALIISHNFDKKILELEENKQKASRNGRILLGVVCIIVIGITTPSKEISKQTNKTENNQTTVNVVKEKTAEEIEAERLANEQKLVEEKAKADQVAAEKAEQEKQDKISRNKINIQVAYKDQIKNILKAPSTAKFPWLVDVNYDESKQTYWLESYVDSQNGFGAMIRSNFYLEYKEVDGSIKTIYCLFDGKEILNNR